MSFVDKQVDALRQQLECPIDFVGQQTVERLSQQILWTSAAISFVFGFVFQSLRTTFILFGLGVLFCCVATLPPWPMYNSNPVKWTDSSEGKAGKAKGTGKGKEESKKDK